MNPEFGYNDTNTNAPHTNVNDSRILLSGGSSRVMRRGNNVIDEMMLEVAKKQLKDYMDGVRKTKPAKKYIDILESSGIISKIKSEMSGGVNRLKKAKRWRDFSNETALMGIDTAKYEYSQYKDAMNPVNSAISSTKKLFGGKTNEQRVEEAVNPVGAESKKTAKAVNKLFGLEKDIKKKVSPWVDFVKSYAIQHNIPYKEAMKQASPIYKQLKKGNGYSRIG
jgi:hypothetical protein